MSRQAAIRLAKKTVTLPCFHRSTDSRNNNPDEYMPLDRCKELKAAGRGDFINRGKAFRRFDVSDDSDRKSYNPSARKGESLNINQAMMDRYVQGDGYAKEAVEAWA